MVCVDGVFDGSLDFLLTLKESFDAEGLVVGVKSLPACLGVVGVHSVDDVYFEMFYYFGIYF